MLLSIRELPLPAAHLLQHPRVAGLQPQAAGVVGAAAGQQRVHLCGGRGGHKGAGMMCAPQWTAISVGAQPRQTSWCRRPGPAGTQQGKRSWPAAPSGSTALLRKAAGQQQQRMAASNNPRLPGEAKLDSSTVWRYSAPQPESAQVRTRMMSTPRCRAGRGGGMPWSTDVRSAHASSR